MSTAGIPTAAESSRWRELLAGRGLIGRFVYLMITQGVVVALGLAYWTSTTRLVLPQSVGLAAAAISAGSLIGALGVLGTGTFLLAELGRTRISERRGLITTSMAVCSATVLVLALGTWAISPVLGHSLSQLARQPLIAVLFVVGTVGQTASGVFDAAAIGLRNGPLQLVRNATASGLRLVLVLAAILLGARNATGLMIAWTASIVISLASCFHLMRLPPLAPEARGFAARRALVRRFGATALQHHVLNLAITSVSFFLPVLAAVLVDPRQFAFFSTALLVSSTALLPPALLAMSLFAETTGDADALRRQLRKTLPIGFACCLGVVALVEPTAGEVLRIFGRNYALHGEVALRLLVLGGIGYVVKDHYVSIRRAQGRLTTAARVVASATLLELLGAALGGHFHGLTGLCAGWVAATVVEGVAFAPVVVQATRDQGSIRTAAGACQGAPSFLRRRNAALGSTAVGATEIGPELVLRGALLSGMPATVVIAGQIASPSTRRRGGTAAVFGSAVVTGGVILVVAVWVVGRLVGGGDAGSQRDPGGRPHVVVAPSSTSTAPATRAPTTGGSTQTSSTAGLVTAASSSSVSGVRASTSTTRTRHRGETTVTGSTAASGATASRPPAPTTTLPQRATPVVAGGSTTSSGASSATSGPSSPSPNSSAATSSSNGSSSSSGPGVSTSSGGAISSPTTKAPAPTTAPASTSTSAQPSRTTTTRAAASTNTSPQRSGTTTTRPAASSTTTAQPSSTTTATTTTTAATTTTAQPSGTTTTAQPSRTTTTTVTASTGGLTTTPSLTTTPISLSIIVQLLSG